MPNEVVATLKGDGSAPWAVIHAETVEEAERLIEEAYKGSFFQNIAEAGTLLAAATRVANGLNAPAASPPGIDWQKVGQQAQPARQALQPQPQAQQWNNPPAQQDFNGTPHPQGKTCPTCGAGVVGKQPREKRMWTCPNQRSKGDGHYVEWING